MRMAGEHRFKNAIQHMTAFVERAKDDPASGGDNFQWRRDGGGVPARIALGIFGAGGQLQASLSIELAQLRG